MSYPRRWLAVAVAALALIAFSHLLRPSPPREADRCSGQRFTMHFAPHGAAPYIELEAGGQRGAFLVDYGATASTLSRDRFPAAAASSAVSLSLPSFASGRFNLTRYWAQREPAGGQLGVIGTDFLTRLTADISYAAGDMRLSPAPCDPERLRRRGLVPVAQAGFFSSDVGRLAPGRLAVPVVFLDIGGVRTWAQIDSGYDDVETAPAIDINRALYRQLAAAGVRLTRQADVTVSTCSGVETRQVYAVERVGLVTESGAAIRELADAKLVLKGADSCGGIAALGEPAAQVAASVLARIGDIVVDPAAETVWLARQR